MYFKDYDWNTWRALQGEKNVSDLVPYADTIEENGQEKLRIFIDADLFPGFEDFANQAVVALAAHVAQISPVTGLWTKKAEFKPLSSKPLFLYEYVEKYGYSRLWINALTYQDEKLFKAALEAGRNKREELDRLIKEHGYAGAYCRIEKWPETPRYNSLLNEDAADDFYERLIISMSAK